MLEQEHLQSTCHQLETCLGNIAVSTRNDPQHIRAFNDARQQFSKDSQSVRHILDGLGNELKARLLGVALTKDAFNQLKTAIEHHNWSEANQVIQTFDTVPAKKLVRQWSAEAQRLADSQNKQVKVFIEGEALLISRRLFDQLEAPLIHLLRNCVSHGIETASERIRLNKPAVGQIGFRCLQKNDRLFLEISDDGHGIRWEEIIHKASHHPDLDQQQVEQFVIQDEAWRILFLPGFTNSQHTSTLAGRGFGLNALLAAVTEAGGDITVRSELEHGTKFILSLPAYPDSEITEPLAKARSR
jgi:signal transduction histidine kinase